MWQFAFAVRIAEEDLSAPERLPAHPPEIPLEIHLEIPVLPVHPVRLEILHPSLALEKTPYMIAPFND